MTTRSLTLVLAATLTLSACGGGDSSLNPFRWFGGGGRKPAPATLDPAGGYANATDPRRPFPRIVSARWQTIPEGQMLVVTGLAPTKGWWDVALLPEEPMPEGRVRPGPDGVLRLRLVGSPPLPDQPAARMAADPRVDTITASFSLSAGQIARLRGVVVSGASNSVTLGR